MREGTYMLDCYITFRSVTRAQRGARLLDSLGLDYQLQRTPKSIAAQGCGYALCVRSSEAPMALQALRQNELQYQRVYLGAPDGSLEEWYL